jgi:enoyl-CoA hydratase
MELVLTGSPSTAMQMDRLGLLNKVCSPDEDVLDEAIRLAKTVAANSSAATGLAKQAVKAGKHKDCPLTSENLY